VIQSIDATKAQPTWASPLAFLRTNRDGAIVEAGGALTALLGQDREEIVGGPFAAWGAARWPASIVSEMVNKLADGEPFVAFLPSADQSNWSLTVMMPLGGGIMTLHTGSADPLYSQEAAAEYRAVEEAESAARAADTGDEEILAAGKEAAAGFWASSAWATREEFMAAATMAAAAAVRQHSEQQPTAGPDAAQPATPGDPITELVGAIGGLESILGERLIAVPQVFQLAEGLRETSWGALEIMGTLGRIASAAVDGSSQVSSQAPALLSTARAVAGVGIRAVGELETLVAGVRPARRALAEAETQLGTVVLLARLVATAAAAAWPPADPGPDAVPAASVTEMAHGLLGCLDDLIAKLAEARDGLESVAARAGAAVEDVSRFHSFAAAWRVQLPRWNVAGQVEPQLAVIDGRQRLAAEHVELLRGLSDASSHGGDWCIPGGLFEPMNTIDQLLARGSRRRRGGTDQT
jgi:hypothetical protein